VRTRERALSQLAREHQALKLEQAKSERLLLNVLPEPVAARLKDDDRVIADACPEVTVLFADSVGFTPLSERLAASDLVSVLDRVFARWDALALKHGVEKIRTIGDAYMVAAGIPLSRADHAEAIAALALDMGPELAHVATETGLALELRIGIDSGPVIAGVIGRAKFIYDLWGDTVNTASRMESHALPSTIQVTQRTYDRLRDRFELRPRGTIEVKGKGTAGALGMEPEQLAVVIDALGTGLWAHHMLHGPRTVPPDLFSRALALIVDGIAARAVDVAQPQETSR
jgi:adenylate cyclase